MPSVNFDSSPADVRWPVIRGDDSDMGLQFAVPVTLDPIDITGFEYISSVATGKGGTVVATPTVTIDDAGNGEVTVSMTDAQTDLLTDSTYWWDLVENPDSTTEHTLITGRLTVSGRATTGAIVTAPDDDEVILDGGDP